MHFVTSESDLHPLVATARPRAGDLSVDTNADAAHRVSEVEETQRTFGFPTIDTQGSAGSRVRDLDDRPHRRRPHGTALGGAGMEDDDERLGYLGDPNAPPDSVGPQPLVDAEMTEADFVDGGPAVNAAAAAVLAAHRSGHDSTSGMLDALEAAEAAFERQQQQRQAQGQAAGHPRHLKLGSHRSGAAAAAARHQGAPPPDTPRKAAICEGTREKILQKLFEALQANPRYGSEPARDVMSYAQEVEDALFTRSHSKQVYLSQVSNAVRLARTAPDVADIPRIASGEPREVAEGHTAPEATPYISGMQGIVIKPQYD